MSERTFTAVIIAMALGVGFMLGVILWNSLGGG